MITADDLKLAASSIADQAVRETYVLLAEEVIGRVSKGFSGSWTFRNFGKWVGKRQEDPLLHNCVYLLVVKEHPKILDMHFRFFADEDDVGEELTDEEVQEALKQGVFVNKDGIAFADFKARLTPYFVPAVSP